MKRVLQVSLLFLFAFSLLSRLAASSQNKVDFARDIQPIFAAHCADCHGSKKQEANLRLDDQQSAQRVIQAGKGADSRLLQRVLGLNGEPRMPLHHAPLSSDQIKLLQRWIDEGASWPQSAIRTPQSAGAKHWAFIAPVRPCHQLSKTKPGCAIQLTRSSSRGWKTKASHLHRKPTKSRCCDG